MNRAPVLDLQSMLAQRFPAWFNGARAPWARSMARTLARISRVDEANAFLARHHHLQGLAFVEAVLANFDCRYVIDHVERERIPQQGRVLLLANHPLGALDALALLKLVGDIRSDVRIVANDFLEALPGMRELILPLRILGGRPQPESLRAVERALEQEQAVIVFPAGEVARLSWRGIVDTPWRKGFMRFARRTDTPLLPIHLSARNSALFYGMSALYKPFGTALLPREMFRSRGRRIEARVGHALRVDEVQPASGDAAAAVATVRRALYAIGRGRAMHRPREQALAHAGDLRAIAREVEGLAVLGETADGKRIVCGRLHSDSALLREIARVRELTFRAVGEGTGKRLDTDEFDSWYDHIVLWDAQACAVAGAYRATPGARVLDRYGLRGLYTASLFDYRPHMLGVLERGMELGRSFVSPQYWGTRSLDYLWFGIGAYLRAHPQIRYLLGPVSISAALPPRARDLLVSYYATFHGECQALAVSRHPLTATGLPPEFAALDADQAFKVLRANLDALGVRVPTLYKQYTELCEPGGARFLAFGVDPEFSGSVDGLILVDLAMMKPHKRARYIDGRCKSLRREVEALA
jgi:putative hemolysin